MIFLRLQRITRVSILKSTNCDMVMPSTLKTFHCISLLFSTMSILHTNKTTPLVKQNFFTYFRFCIYITKFCFMISTKCVMILNKFMFIIRQLFCIKIPRGVRLTIHCSGLLYWLPYKK